jgi:hypothetical protein
MVLWQARWPAFSGPGFAGFLLIPSRFSGLISIFPVIRYACLTENNPDQFDEACFRANIVREDQHTALIGLDTDHGVRRLPVIATFLEAATLRTVESDNT